MCACFRADTQPCPYMPRTDLVQSYGPDGEMYFQPYHEAEDGSFLSHLDPARLAVPKYQVRHPFID